MEFRAFLYLLYGKKKIILGIPVLAVIIYLLLLQVLPPTYEAEGVILIRNANFAPWVNAYDQSAADQELYKSSLEIVGSNTFLQDVIKGLPFKMTREELLDTVKVRNLAATDIISVKVVSRDPMKAALTANAVLAVFSDKIAQLYDIRVSYLEKAEVPVKPYHSSPSISIGLVLIISFLWVVNSIMLAANQREG